MEINWTRMSEIIFSNLVSGIVLLVIAYITYRLGEKSSDKRWEKDSSL